MNQYNKDLNNPEVRSLFEKKNFAFVATSMKDGSPHVTPTWVDIDNGFILINTAVGRVKDKNSERNSKIAVSIADKDNPYHMVTVRGDVIEKITGEVAENHIDKMAKKYMDKDKYPRTTSDEERVLLKIRPRNVFHMKQ